MKFEFVLNIKHNALSIYTTKWLIVGREIISVSLSPEARTYNVWDK